MQLIRRGNASSAQKRVRAHRVRQTRNKKLEESLKMAKRAKITHVGTHDMSATKKIFELNDAGKKKPSLKSSSTIYDYVKVQQLDDICQIRR
jgi:LPS O-antigen subunit length determinant protein (WzzB/FepE family)